MGDAEDRSGETNQTSTRSDMAGSSQRDGQAIGLALTEPLRTDYQTWIAANAAWIAAIAAADGVEAGATDAEATARHRAVSAVAEGRAVTPADFAAVLHVWWEEHGPQLLPEDLAREEDDLDPSCIFVARAWRSATGRAGWPRLP